MLARAGRKRCSRRRLGRANRRRRRASDTGRRNGRLHGIRVASLNRAMPRDLVIGNGSLLIGFDAQYRLADFYYPHVGMENHAASRFRFGVFADGELRWIEDAPWRKELTYLRDTLVTDVT